MVIVQMPLPSRSERIAALLKREAVNHADWVEIQLGLVREISEARQSFKDDVQFGHWFKACGFDERINKDDRSAYISMARDPPLAKQVFDATRRESIRRIERMEFRPLHDAKQDSPGGETSKKKRGRPPKAKQLERALAAIAELEAKSEPLTEEIVAMTAGVAAGTANKALALHRAKAAPPPDGFSDKGKLTIAKAIEIEKKRLAKRYQAEVQAEVTRRIKVADDHVRRHNTELEAQLTGLRRMLQQKGVFTKHEFNDLLRCVHPDTKLSTSDQIRNHIFDILRRAEPRLVKEA